MADGETQRIDTRPLRRSRRRVAPGHLVMLLAGLLGVALTLGLLNRADATQPVVVADRDLAPGETLESADLRTVELAAGTPLAAALAQGVPADLEGHVVVHPIRAGEPLASGDVGEPRSVDVPRTMSFPVASARAVGGALRSGDRVDVIAADSRAGGSWFAASGLEVLAVESSGVSPLQGGSDEMTVTVAVDADAALGLAGALAVHEVTLVRSTGAPALDDAGVVSRITSSRPLPADVGDAPDA
jgi:Flp pilus assembly protein CpaB